MSLAKITLTLAATFTLACPALADGDYEIYSGTRFELAAAVELAMKGFDLDELGRFIYQNNKACEPVILERDISEYKQFICLKFECGTFRIDREAVLDTYDNTISMRDGHYACR